MRVYMAGLHTARFKLRRYPFVLESYHYMTASLAQRIRLQQDRIFLDSGAFSMFTKNVKVDLKKYAGFIRTNTDIIEVASNLDVIGRGHEQLSYDRQKYLEKQGAMIKPVHHVRDADTWLQRYLDEGYDYIFLGGMVPESTKTLQIWLDHVWSKYLTDDAGKPRVKVHGFGLTSLPLMVRYPWFSVDSTSWSVWARYGFIGMDIKRDGQTRTYHIFFSEKSSSKHELDSWHFQSLPQGQKEIVLQHLERMETAREKNPVLEQQLEKLTGVPQGFNVEALTKLGYWRELANIDFLERMSRDGAQTFSLQQETLF